jgi:hypothetical protein
MRKDGSLNEVFGELRGFRDSPLQAAPIPHSSFLTGGTPRLRLSARVFLDF